MTKTRFSPSPTGLIHLGNVRAALFSALYAAHEKGTFILRIEDTDQSRSEQKFAEGLQKDLHWLGINWQEGPDRGGPHAPYWQSQRHEIYDQYYRALNEKGQTYDCYCSEQELLLNRKLQLSRGQAPRYPGTCRHLSQEQIEKKFKEGKKPAVRFLVPTHESICFEDLIKGSQSFNGADIGDFIIRRADGSASFLFCNAIDDALMGVTHVIRGEDHLANTPRQLMILKTLGLRLPHYAHLSLILGEDGAKLSKRHGSFSLHDLRVENYLPLAVVNYLARLSHPYEEKQLLSFEKLAKLFQLHKVSRAPARFDKAQLLHWQKEAVLALTEEGFWQWLDGNIQEKVPESKKALFIEVMRQNILFPEEALRWADILFSAAYSLENNVDVMTEAGERFFKAAIESVKQFKTDFKASLNDLKERTTFSGKRLFLPLRLALTGEEHGPELAHIVVLLGEEELLTRFQKAIEFCEKHKC